MLAIYLLMPLLKLKLKKLRIKFLIIANLSIVFNGSAGIVFDEILKQANLATKLALDTVLQNANKNTRKIEKL